MSLGQMASTQSCFGLTESFKFNNPLYPDCGDMGPASAQYILYTSLKKLDRARRSRTGIRLRHGLLITATVHKARQLLKIQENQQLNSYGSSMWMSMSHNQPYLHSSNMNGSVSNYNSLSPNYCINQFTVVSSEVSTNSNLLFSSNNGNNFNNNK